MEKLDELKVILREEDYPFFTDSELTYHLSTNNDDVSRTAYRCLIIKAEDTTLNVSGLTTGDTSKYFKRLASQYRPRNTGTLN